MDTLQATAAPPIRRRLDLSRYAAIGFALCFVASVVWAGGQFDVYSSDLDELTAHFAESGSTTAYAWSAYLLLPLAALFLAWTVARFRTSLGRTTDGAPTAGPPTAGPPIAGTPIAGTAAIVGGAVLAVALVVGGIVEYTGAAVAAGTADGEFPADPQSGFALLLAGGNLFVVKGLGAAVLAWAVALGARRTGQIPGWLAWVGFVLVPLLPYAWFLFMLPWLAFLIWLIAVSLMLKTDR